MEYCIVIKSIWTGSKRIYPIIYGSQEEATNAIPTLPFSSRNNEFVVKEFVDLTIV
jgi:hypothetical protein